MIRNAVLHINGEQPLVADLYEMPVPADVTLVCTNIRTPDGKKPVFVDHADSVFVFPYLHIRFVEILAGTATGLPDNGDGAVIAVAAPTDGSAPGDDGELDLDLELDEDFLRRIKEV